MKKKIGNLILLFFSDFEIWPLTLILEKNVTISHSYEQHFPMLPIILFPTIYNLAVCSLSTLNPSEQFSIYITIKDTKDTAKYASYLDLHLDTDSKGPLRAKFYDTINDTFVFIYLCMCQYSSSTYIWSYYLSADRIFLNLWLLLWSMR